MTAPVAPTLDTAVTAMLNTLAAYLPPAAGALPDSTVSIANLTEKTVGLGNLRGFESRAGFAAVALRGIRADAVVRFGLWAAGPAQADAALTALISRLAVDDDKLRAAGFHRLGLDVSPPAEFIESLKAWRKHADYKVLYEFAYSDSDDAGGLIARIPIALSGAGSETMTVTDSLVRWDSAAAPPLVLRGASIGALSLLAHAAGVMPGGAVRLTRTFDGAPGPPAGFPTLAAFIAAVGGSAPQTRHATTVFPTFGAFIAACAPGGDPVELDAAYDPLTLVFAAPIVLPALTDRFELAYEKPAFDTSAVVYVRATHASNSL